MSEIIAGRSNPRVKHVRRLQTDRRFRYEERAFVAEGARWLTELVRAQTAPLQLFHTPEWAAQDDHAALLGRLPVQPTAVEASVMAAMSDTETAPGVLAVVAMPSLPLPPRPTLLLLLDGVSNPGNLGTILRTAAAAGVEGVLLGPGCVDPFNPKVVRGSMGALLRLPLLQGEWEELAVYVRGLAVRLASPEGGAPYTAVDWRRPSALLVGGEARGAGPAAERLAAERVTIPMQDTTESLNAAVAAGIILFEAARQRV